MIEYPTGSIQHDHRWPEWLAAFVAEATLAFECECIEGPEGMFDPG